MIDAYKAGIPGNGKPFPDGARMAKIHWIPKKQEAYPGQPTVPGAQHDVDFMVKDSKRFADSGGWGYAVFEYDACIRYVPARQLDRPAAAGERRQVRVRLPHDRAEEGLRFHRVRTPLNGESTRLRQYSSLLPLREKGGRSPLPLIARQHALHRPCPSGQLPLPRRRAHRRLEAAFQPPGVGEF